MRLAKSGRAFRGLTLVCVMASLTAPLAYAQKGRGGDGRRGAASRLEQLVEANVIATHAFQIMLATKSGQGDAACYARGGLSDGELEALVKHQNNLLKSKAGEVSAWARGGRSGFDPSKDLEPILKSGLALPPGSPANVFTDYLRAHTRSRSDEAGLRS